MLSKPGPRKMTKSPDSVRIVLYSTPVFLVVRDHLSFCNGGAVIADTAVDTRGVAGLSLSLELCDP